jgi:hypothetical protein
MNEAYGRRRGPVKPAAAPGLALETHPARIRRERCLTALRAIAENPSAQLGVMAMALGHQR